MATLDQSIQPRAQELMAQGDWQQAAALYEQAAEAEPQVKIYAWYLGLALIMLEREEEAQLLWLMAMAEGEPEAVEAWTQELLVILDTEAERQQMAEAHQQAWVLRQHIRELAPASLSNLLLLLRLSVELDLFRSEDLVGWGLLTLLEERREAPLPLLSQALIAILSRYPADATIEALVERCRPYFDVKPLPFQPFLDRASALGHRDGRPDIAAQLLTQAQRLMPDTLPILQQLSCSNQDAGRLEAAIAGARRCYELSETLVEKLASNHVLLRGLMNVGSDWAEIERIFERHLALLDELLVQSEAGAPPPMSPAITRWLFTVPFFQPYLRDTLATNRHVQNRTAAIAQTYARDHQADRVSRYRFEVKGTVPRLRVGYVSTCLRRHSVGWLARWLYEHHDRDQVEIYSYMVNYRSRADKLRDWYVDQSDRAYEMGAKGADIADCIYNDDVQILVDLDSITSYTTCDIMALKPAPVQVSWLGWDASGIPAIDYYIADPYVLPEGAEEHYSEKLWRLPQTYVAVDGFELNPPTLRRRDLEIADDAVVFLSAQRGYKRHPHTIRLQLRILRQVPNSYFLIKALDLDESLKAAFIQLAEEEGVARDRLRFLTRVSEEATHRANLAIADVVLDTYPYNGATTTLETLWVGVPLVTRVGETFSSRNSYTMMRNAGITEGIAWSDEEYVAWGVRLGKDPELRRQVAWKLWRSRQTAPLWNGRQFARQMEQAYRQMWERYASSP